jgi:hypothetical protein
MHSHRLAAGNSQRAKARRLGATSKAEAAKAVHKHEAHLHKGQPATKLKKGGKVEGAGTKARGDKKSRIHRDMGGGLPMPSSGASSPLQVAKAKELQAGLAGAGMANPADALNNMGAIKAAMDQSAQVQRPNPAQLQALQAANAGAGGMKRGGKVTKLARGGKVKDKGGTKITIAVGVPDKAAPAALPIPIPRPPMPMPPVGGPPGLPPGIGGPPPMGPPPGLPGMPRKNGGRTNMPHLTAGSGSGEGRLQKMGIKNKMRK